MELTGQFHRTLAARAGWCQGNGAAAVGGQAFAGGEPLQYWRLLLLVPCVTTDGAFVGGAI